MRIALLSNIPLDDHPERVGEVTDSCRRRGWAVVAARRYQILVDVPDHLRPVELEAAFPAFEVATALRSNDDSALSLLLKMQAVTATKSGPKSH